VDFRRKEELKKEGTDNIYLSCSGTVLGLNNYGRKSGTPIG
jgi:hypothetical protein